MADDDASSGEEPAGEERVDDRNRGDERNGNADRPPDGPPARDTYDDLAPGYEDITGAAIREHYEWPVVRELLPSLDGRRVLDAACGDGFYTERLVAAGADAVGVDASPEMVARARERFGDPDTEIPVHEADLTAGLPFLDDGSFDLVLCQLALEHVEDWPSVFGAFARVLRPGGRVVVSTSHPVRDYVDAEYGAREHVLADGATYGQVERADRDWGDEEPFVVPFYRRPLQAVFEPATDAGLLVERVREPGVTDAFAEREPDRIEPFVDGPPNFLCLRFLKPTDGG
ncbi:class I SAM-dependent methyltransferase [Halosimplex halophilum]|uniref:class I SAM-dependent methyltransferase n=1 Tax=Halosimplex halophilum TaxID=2559572 RepID=UPI00107FA5BF|nr:class I SAM-dependent methyltransferase [Halosimplex halophilum]